MLEEQAKELCQEHRKWIIVVFPYWGLKVFMYVHKKCQIKMYSSNDTNAFTIIIL